jgi:hypothetical protein
MFNTKRTFKEDLKLFGYIAAITIGTIVSVAAVLAAAMFYTGYL